MADPQVRQAPLKHPRRQLERELATNGAHLHAVRMSGHNGQDGLEFSFGNALRHAVMVCRKKNLYATN